MKKYLNKLITETVKEILKENQANVTTIYRLINMGDKTIQLQKSGGTNKVDLRVRKIEMMKWHTPADGNKDALKINDIIYVEPKIEQYPENGKKLVISYANRVLGGKPVSNGKKNLVKFYDEINKKQTVESKKVSKK